MSEEELSISVRWKRPAKRAAQTVLGAAAVALSVRLSAGEPATVRDVAMPPALEWRCESGALDASLRMAEPRIADSSGSDENGAERSSTGRRTAVLLEERLTRQIIRIFYRVYNRLGYGRLESVYRNAMAIELRKAGLAFGVEQPIEVWYDGEVVGVFRADLVVEGKVIVELKAGRTLGDAAHAQLLNYLTCSDVEVGLLLFFGPQPRFHRAVYTRNREREPHPR